MIKKLKNFGKNIIEEYFCYNDFLIIYYCINIYKIYNY